MRSVSQQGSTRALTLAEAPEGFAAFVPTAYLRPQTQAAIVYVRFPDDDNRDGILDAKDQASVWRLDIDFDDLFRGTAELGRPEPLTDGSDDELFPTADDGWLYVTRGTFQQDIVRFPLDGMFPRYEAPERYLELAETVEDPRTRWFVFRLAEARTTDGLLRAQLGLKIANLHLGTGRLRSCGAEFEPCAEIHSR